MAELLTAIQGLETQKKGIKQGSRGKDTLALRQLNTQLCGKYTELLTVSPDLAAAHHAEDKLWRLVRSPIDSLRRQLQTKKATEELKAGLRAQLDAGYALYMRLVVALRAAAEAGPCAAPFPALERCFNRLGDLTRYREHLGEAQEAARLVARAGSFYQVAALLNPGAGVAHNQLAVMCLGAKDELTAVYRYARSLLSVEPFPTAKDNLMQALEKNRVSLAALEDSPQVKAVRSWGAKALSVTAPRPGDEAGAKAAQEAMQRQRALRGWTLISWVRLTCILWTSASTERVPDVLRNATEDLCRLVRCKGLPMPTSSVLLPLAGVTIFCAHTSRAGGVAGGASANPQRAADVATYAAATVLSLLGALAKEAGKPLSGAHKALRSHARQVRGGGSSPETLTAAGVALSTVQADTFSLLDTIGLLCDWVHANPSTLAGPLNPPAKAPAAAGRGKKGRKGKAVPVDAGPMPPAQLLTASRRAALSALCHLGNKLMLLAEPLLASAADGPGALALLQAVGGAAPPHVQGTGLVLLAPATPPPDASLPAPAWATVALPEEADMQGYLPMAGMYDGLSLPGSTPGKVWLGGLEGYIPDLKATHDGRQVVPTPSPVISAAKRIGKIVRLLRAAGGRDDVGVKVDPGSGRFTLVEDGPGAPPAAFAAAPQPEEAGAEAAAPAPAPPTSTTAALVAAAAASRRSTRGKGGRKGGKSGRAGGGFLKPKSARGDKGPKATGEEGAAPSAPKQARGGRRGKKGGGGRGTGRNVGGRVLVDVDAGEKRTTASQGPRHVTGIMRAGEVPGMVGVPAAAFGSAEGGEVEVEGETILAGGGMFNMTPMPFPMVQPGMPFPPAGMHMPYAMPGAYAPAPGTAFPAPVPTHGFPYMLPPAPYYGQEGAMAHADAGAGQGGTLGFASPLSGLQGSMVTLDAGQAAQPAPHAPEGHATPPAAPQAFDTPLGGYGGASSLGEQLWGTAASPAPSPTKTAGGHDSGFGGALGLGLLPEGELKSFGGLEG